jgi:hypothetical protein
VVLGKLIATSLSASYGLLAIFPVLAITLTMGGVTHGEFWRMVLVFLNTLFLSLTTGLCVSAVSRQDNRAMAGTFLLLLLIVGGLPLFEFVMVQVNGATPFTFSLPSPLTAYRLSFDAGYRTAAASFWRSLVVTFLMSGALLILASVLLPRLWQEGPGPVRTIWREAQISEAEFAKRVAKRARLLDINPVLWLTSRQGGPAWLWWVGFGLVSALMLILSSLLPGPGSWGFSTIASLPLFLVRIMIGLQACRFFVEARRTGALELLLCTPLSVNDILDGQWLALKRKYLVPIVVVFGTLLLPVVLTFVSQPDNATFALWAAGSYTLAGEATFLADVFAIAWVGMLVGLTAKKPNLASGLTLFYAVVLPWFVFCVPRLLVDIPLIFWARDKLHRELRALISQRYLGPVVPRYAPANSLAKPPPLLGT